MHPCPQASCGAALCTADFAQSACLSLCLSSWGPSGPSPRVFRAHPLFLPCSASGAVREGPGLVVGSPVRCLLSCCLTTLPQVAPALGAVHTPHRHTQTPRRKSAGSRDSQGWVFREVASEWRWEGRCRFGTRAPRAERMPPAPTGPRPACPGSASGRPSHGRRGEAGQAGPSREVVGDEAGA